MRGEEVDPQWRVALDLGLDRFDYAESVTLPLKSTENGTLPIGQIAIERRAAASLLTWGGSLSLAIGKTVYDGSTQSGTPVTSTTSNSHLDLRGYLMATPQSGVMQDFTFYAGLGFHRWQRDLSGSPGGYNEDYYWLYVPLGARYDFVFGESLRLRLDLSIESTVFGWIDVQLSQAGNFSDATGLLGSIGGAKLQAPLLFSLTPTWTVGLASWIEFFLIGEGPPFNIKNRAGTVVSSGLEPASRTIRYGATVQVSVVI